MLFQAPYGISAAFPFVLVSPSNYQWLTSATIDRTNDTRIVKDGVDGGALTNDPSYIAGGWWWVTLSTTEMQAKRISVSIRDASATATWYDTGFEVQTIGHASAAVPVVITTNAFDANTVQIIGSSTSATNLGKSTQGILYGTVDDAITAPTTTSFASAEFTEATANHYKDSLCMFITGALAGQRKGVTGYALTSGQGVFTVQTLTEAPADGDYFVIL